MSLRQVRAMAPRWVDNSYYRNDSYLVGFAGVRLDMYATFQHAWNWTTAGNAVTGQFQIRSCKVLEGDHRMKFKGISAAFAAASLVAMPTLAAAAPVGTPLTAPAVEKVKGDNAAFSGTGIGLTVLAVAAAVAGIVAAVQDGDDNDQPNSP